MGYYNEAVLRQHLLLFLVPYGIDATSSPPTHASSCVACCCPPSSAARHPPPVIRCLLSSKKLPPNLVDCHCRHHPLLLHCLLPFRLTCRIIRHPPSTQRHCRRCHCCNPNHSCCADRVSLPALVTLSARRRLCRRNPLLAPTAIVTPSVTRSCHAVLPPALQHCPRHCLRDAPMQKL